MPVRAPSVRRLVGLCALLSAFAPAHAQVTSADWPVYVDPQQRFTFRYPPAWGPITPGTDDGYGHRVAAVRLGGLTGLGGEVVLTTGTVLVDIQVLGGLYDALTLDLLPESDRRTITTALPPVTLATFCGLARAADHVAGLVLPARLDGIARKLDAMRNRDPVLHHCQVVDGSVVFHKEATFESGAFVARQHLYGAIRFPGGPYGSLQIVRGSTSPPSATDLETLAGIVRSFAAR